MQPNGMPAHSLADVQTSPSGWSPTTPSLDELHGDFSRLAVPELQDLARRWKRPANAAVLRVAQLDAGRLDAELAGMLQEQLRRAFSLFRPELISVLEPELRLLLDLLIFSCSVWIGRPPPGAALMNLRYRDERHLGSGAAGKQQIQQLPHTSAPCAHSALASGRTGVEGPGLTRGQRIAYGLLILLRYSWTRAGSVIAQAAVRAGVMLLQEPPELSELMTSGFNQNKTWLRCCHPVNIVLAARKGQAEPGSWAPRAWRIMRHTEAAEKVLSAINLLVFLRRGVYRSISERLLGARLVLQRVSMARALSFEYLNRQLVWQELSELLLFLLPLLDVTQLRRRLLVYLPRISGTGTSGDDVVAAGHLPNQACGLCSSATMTQPYAAEPCGHLFCYYCLRSSTEADMHFLCPLCSTRVAAIKPASRPIGKGAVPVQ